MATQTQPKRLVIRWTTLKGFSAIIVFLIVAVLVEYVAVVYAMSLGVKDPAPLQWNLQVPSTDWSLVITISPLFHLVPLAVIITLLFSWLYLTKQVAVRSPEAPPKARVGPPSRRAKETRLEGVERFFGKIKSGLLRVKGISYIWQKIHFARATVRSAVVVILFFLIFTLLASVIVYPQLIYHSISSAYQNNPALLGFVKGTGEAFAPIGSALNSGLAGAAPEFRNLAISVGGLIAPLADLDNMGKYLVFQNAAAWISAFIALFYGYMRRARRYRRIR